jgi:hypothetical protein
LFGFFDSINETNQIDQTNQMNQMNQTDYARSEKGAKVSTAWAVREEVLSAERDAWYNRPG